MMDATGYGRRKKLAITAGVLILAILTVLDYVTGYEFGFFIFYFIPVSIVSWNAGSRLGLATAFASALCWYLSDRLSHHPYSHAYFIYWETFMRLASFVTTAFTVSRIQSFLQSERKLNERLKLALDQNAKMRRFLEECPECGCSHRCPPEDG